MWWWWVWRRQLIQSRGKVEKYVTIWIGIEEGSGINQFINGYMLFPDEYLAA